MRDLSQSFTKQLANLPAVESVLIDYLTEEDEQWAEYLQDQFKAGVDFVDAFNQGLYNHFPRWKLPDSVTQKLAELPSVRRTVISYFTSMENSSTTLLNRVISANVEHMRDLQGLLSSHLDSLPTLKILWAAYYRGIPELKRFEVR